MNIDTVIPELESIIPGELIKYNEPMKNHTSFKVGGPADILVLPEDAEQIVNIIRLCKRYGINFFIMGNGSNLIVRDGGYRGVIVKLSSMNSVSVEGFKVRAQAGALLSNVSKEALKHCLKGFEFASGIPGTVGGAVAMNAGAYGPEIKDVIEYAVAADLEGHIYRLSKDELELTYRNSVIQKKNYIVLEAVFSLESGDYNEIKDLMDNLNKRRVEKQPLNYPSAGSTFKRPEGYFAGKLIEDAGLKGISIGGAKVSEKHAGFIINYDSASAGDVLNLIRLVQEKIKKQFNIELETEVKVIGEERKVLT